MKDAVIRVPEGLTAEHLYRISEMLTEQLADQHARARCGRSSHELFRDACNAPPAARRRDEGDGG